MAAAMFSSVSSSWLLSMRASSITCWPSRTSTPSSWSANRNGGSTRSMPSGRPATPSALRMSRISSAARLKRPAFGDTAPRMPTMPASDWRSGICGGRSKWWRGSTSSALTGRARGGDLRAMRSSVCRIIYRSMDVEAFRRFEQVGHDRLAATYGDFFAANTARAIEPLLDGAGVRAGLAVLDVACGPGHVAAAAARRGARVTGVDLSVEMLALAVRAHVDVRFREADAEALPFTDCAFDAVVCNFGI